MSTIYPLSWHFGAVARGILIMADLAGRSMINSELAYSQSLEILIASLEPRSVILNCLEEHIVPILTTSHTFKDPEDHSPFCILSVGSRDGCVDLPLIEMLSNACEGKARFFERAIEPEKIMLESFCAKAEDLPESVKSKADIEFEWFPMTYQEYVKQKKSNDVQFDIVHFMYSIYFVDIDAALKHCYENELGPKGAIIAVTEDSNAPFSRYGKEFNSHGLILDPAYYYSNEDIRDVARKYGWKYVECPGDSRLSNVTAVFDHSSVEGNLLLDFLTGWVNVRKTVNQENLQKILNFWEKECIVDDSGRKMVNFQSRAIMILKGM